MTEQAIRPKVGVAVILINKEGKILLGLRKGSHGEGTWAFPGGHLEIGETPEDCIRRELLEEVGLHSLRFIPNVHYYTNDIFSEEKHYITLYLICKHFEGTPEIKEKNKCEAWKWFCWDELPKPLFLCIQNLIKDKFDPFKY